MSHPVVLKFGGTSVENPERLQRVSRIIQAHYALNPRLVVVVSAMGQSTDELIDLALKVSPHATDRGYRRELDMLLTAGERISMALLSMALADRGISAVSFTGSQSGILTTSNHGEARIAEIRPIRIEESLANNKVCIVAGFQGVSAQKEITTLGRGGSDTTAVALAAALGAQMTYIYTDVEGFFSADPRLVPSAKLIAALSWSEAYTAACAGAQVLHPRCLELAQNFKIPLRVLSSLSEPSAGRAFVERGTLINEQKGKNSMSSKNLEGSRVLNLSLQKNLRLLRFTQNASAVAKKIHSEALKYLDLRRSAAILEVLVNAENLGEFQALKPSDEQAVNRLSLLGTGLCVADKLHAQLDAHLHDAVLRYDTQDSKVELLVKADAALDELMKQVHQDWVLG